MSTIQADLRINIERPSADRLKALNVAGWPIWQKEVSTFEWSYDESEMCYFLDGEVTITTDRGTTTIRQGDLVTFPSGLKCTWRITRAVRKHYRFG